MPRVFRNGAMIWSKIDILVTPITIQVTHRDVVMSLRRERFSEDEQTPLPEKLSRVRHSLCEVNRGVKYVGCYHEMVIVWREALRFWGLFNVKGFKNEGLLPASKLCVRFEKVGGRDIRVGVGERNFKFRQ